MENNRLWIYDSKLFYYFTIFLCMIGMVIAIKFMIDALSYCFFIGGDIFSFSFKNIFGCGKENNTNTFGLMVHATFGFTISFSGLSLLGFCVEKENFFKNVKEGGKGDLSYYLATILISFLFLFAGLFLMYGFYGREIFKWYSTDLIIISTTIFIFHVLIIFHFKKQIELRTKEEIEE